MEEGGLGEGEGVEGPGPVEVPAPAPAPILDAGVGADLVRAVQNL